MKDNEIEYLSKSLYECYYDQYKEEYDNEKLFVFLDDSQIKSVQKEEVVQFLTEFLLSEEKNNYSKFEIKTEKNKIILTLLIK